MPLVPVLARMELAGIELDLDALAAMSDEFGAACGGEATVAVPRHKP